MCHQVPGTSDAILAFYIWIYMDISVEHWVEELKLVHASLNVRNVNFKVHNSNVILVVLLSKCPLQNATIQTSANGQLPASASENIQLKCNYCRGSFNLKPEILEWEVRTVSNSLLFSSFKSFKGILLLKINILPLVTLFQIVFF